MRDMVFELPSDFGGAFAFLVISELSHELAARNHKPVLLAPVAK
jgi:hypothetical protein